MVCVYCGSSTGVTNSRLQRQSNQVWRRRLCANCHNTFTTHEKTDLSGAIAVKQSDGRLTPFSRDQLFISLYEACKHRARPVQDADGLTQTVITHLRAKLSEGTLDRDAIVNIVHPILKRFDEAAATMYAAYHPTPLKP
jgi:transcriptional repressor NrdR